MTDHAANSMRRYLIEAAAAAQTEYDETVARWQRECAADGVDPETDRAYYAIDRLKARLDSAVAAAERGSLQ